MALCGRKKGEEKANCVGVKRRFLHLYLIAIHSCGVYRPSCGTLIFLWCLWQNWSVRHLVHRHRQVKAMRTKAKVPSTLCVNLFFVCDAIKRWTLLISKLKMHRFSTTVVAWFEWQHKGKTLPPFDFCALTFRPDKQVQEEVRMTFLSLIRPRKKRLPWRISCSERRMKAGNMQGPHPISHPHMYISV